MPIVDSHTHVASSWYEPIETLLWEMDRNGVDQSSTLRQASWAGFVKAGQRCS